jgi:hypothetical protein
MARSERVHCGAPLGTSIVAENSRAERIAIAARTAE